ncbi:gamma-glutamyltransferase family protein [Oceanimonas smirnovii]|uniref:Gamma-glutamyltransferase family protein n=1 Tax=Oceanimonas smirnovii TaxID=264574 RepID=A0ABW7NYH5_9GAMM
MNYFSKQMNITKPALTSHNGIVSSQSRVASEVGAKILKQGGNAVDAAIATSFALGVVEPWMSGIGGGGYMVVKMDKQQPKVIDFGMASPGKLDPEHYEIVDGKCKDLFPWRAVKEERNSHGAAAIAIPGNVRGMQLAWETYGTLPWTTLLEPAIELAEDGLTVDWYAQLIISAAAKDIGRYESTREIFFDQDTGGPKCSAWTAFEQKKCHFDKLTQSLKRIAEHGGDEFYQGELAQSMVRDIQAAGGFLSLEDLAEYRAELCDAGVFEHANGRLYYTPNYTAGQTLRRFFEQTSGHAFQAGTPAAEDYQRYAEVLTCCYEERLLHQEKEAVNACTTHFNVVDKDGNMVSVTQTLLSIFGSRLVLPNSGILMNNGIMWFDPEQGKPNSLKPGAKCLANMCPILGERNDGFRFTLGAAGGRKIFPAVAQLASFVLDFDMDLETAIHTPRIDVSGVQVPVIVDDRLPAQVKAELAERIEVVEAPRTVYPYNFACPSAVGFMSSDNLKYGVTEVMSFWSDSVSEDAMG